jgi:hypothetical protein
LTIGASEALLQHLRNDTHSRCHLQAGWRVRFGGGRWGDWRDALGHPIAVRLQMAMPQPSRWTRVGARRQGRWWAAYGLPNRKIAVSVDSLATEGPSHSRSITECVTVRSQSRVAPHRTKHRPYLAPHRTKTDRIWHLTVRRQTVFGTSLYEARPTYSFTV